MPYPPQGEAPRGFTQFIFVRSLAPPQSIPINEYTLLRLDNMITDVLDEFDVTPGNYSFTPKTYGLYLIMLRLSWGSPVNPGLVRGLINLNGEYADEDRKSVQAGDNPTNTCVYVDYITPNDVIQCEAHQSCDALLTIDDDETQLMIKRLA